MSNAPVTPLTLALSKGRIFEETMPLLAEAGIDVAFGPELHMTHEPAGAFQEAARIRDLGAAKEPDIDVSPEGVDIGECRIPTQAVGWPSCNSSRTSSPQPRMTSNQRRAIAPNSPACSRIQPSMAGSRLTELGKRMSRLTAFTRGFRCALPCR